MKGRREVVTDLDDASERAILETIRASCPDDLIIAEESAPGLGRSDRVWIVDPLDGTNNYAHGYPFFSVAVAVEERGSLVAGVVYDPLRDELFAAERGGGATLNAEPIRVSGAPTLGESLVATGFPYDRSDDTDNNLENLNRFILAVRGIRRGGSAQLDLVYVACGRLDGFWELGLKTWDVAAGGLIVQEAGGRVTNFEGSGWDHRRGDIVASNGSIHAEMLKIAGGSR
jgi:myo-inositol-1(or 4)-monophosphatase